MPTLSTLARVLADVSTYCTAHSAALLLASSDGTCLRSSKSDLFPTMSNGILSSSALTRRICSLRWSIKDTAAQKERGRTHPHDPLLGQKRHCCASKAACSRPWHNLPRVFKVSSSVSLQQQDLGVTNADFRAEQ